MRDINKIVVHCSATKPKLNIGADEIRYWHLQRGWSDIGYHYVIRRDGTLEQGRSVSRAGAHVEGHNDDTIAICLVGGTNEAGEPDCNFTFQQYRCLYPILENLSELYTAEVVGHRDFDGVSKACPCFDANEFFNGGSYA